MTSVSQKIRSRVATQIYNPFSSKTDINLKSSVFWALAQGFVITFILFLAIFSSPLLKNVLETPAAVNRASLFMNTVFSGALLFVYWSISSAEENQSDQIKNQSELMQDQLTAAHTPQIAVDSADFDKRGVNINLANVGNGPATGIDFEPNIETEHDSGFELEVFWVNYRWERGEGDYIGSGESKQFSFIPELIIRLEDEVVYRGNLTGAVELLHSNGIEYLRWKTTVSYNTVFNEQESMSLPGYVVDIKTFL